MEDRLAAVELDAARDVRVVADHRVGAELDRRWRQRAFVASSTPGVWTRPLCMATSTTSPVPRRGDVFGEDGVRLAANAAYCERGVTGPPSAV
jgi:hypothetical protein